MGVLRETLLVASEISKLKDMMAKWKAGAYLTKEEFNEICEQRKHQLQEFKKHIDEVAKSILILENMLKKAFADLEAAKRALDAAKDALRNAKTEEDVNEAQAAVAQAEAAYSGAKTRYLKVEAKKKEKEKDKEKLDKLYEQWKDALDSFKRQGEQRLLELERQGQQLDAQTQAAIQLTKDGMSRGA